MAVTKRAKSKTAKRAPAPTGKSKSAASRTAAPTAKPVVKKAAPKRSPASAKRAPVSAAQRKPATTQPKRTSKAAKAVLAAVPLRASVPKKVGKTVDTVKSSAPYQPKTDVAPIAAAGSKAPTSATPRAAATPAFDPFALARPWLRLGAQMAVANLALQARIAKTAMDLPPTAIAMRQGTAGYSAWLAMIRRGQPQND